MNRLLFAAGSWDMMHDHMQRQSRQLARAGFDARFVKARPGRAFYSRRRSLNACRTRCLTYASPDLQATGMSSPRSLRIKSLISFGVPRSRRALREKCPARSEWPVVGLEQRLQEV